jgi:hypothetical protein
VGWNQLVTPSLDPVVYQGGKALNDWYGWCLATVQAAFNAPWAGSTAWDAWSNRVSIKHADRNLPSGVYVPIWFSGYGGAGHVAIYKDGQIWTSPFTHVPNFYTGYTSIDALAKGYGITYVGWSEDIGGVQVAQYVPDAPANLTGGNGVAEKVTVDTSRILANGVLARNGVAGRGDALDGSNGGDSYIGQDLSNALVQQLFLSDEARQWRDSSDPNSVTGINNRLSAGDAAQGQISQLQGTIDNLQKTITDIQTTASTDSTATKQDLKDALDKVANLTKQLQTANDDLAKLQQNTAPTDSGNQPASTDQANAFAGLVNFLKKLLNIK